MKSTAKLVAAMVVAGSPLLACKSQTGASAESANSKALGQTVILVSSDGDCIVKESSGSAELDRKTCDAALACAAKEKSLERALETCQPPSLNASEMKD